jgi:hypothetical protein
MRFQKVNIVIKNKNRHELVFFCKQKSYFYLADGL